MLAGFAEHLLGMGAWRHIVVPWWNRCFVPIDSQITTRDEIAMKFSFVPSTNQSTIDGCRQRVKESECPVVSTPFGSTDANAID